MFDSASFSTSSFSPLSFAFGILEPVPSFRGGAGAVVWYPQSEIDDIDEEAIFIFTATRQ